MLFFSLSSHCLGAHLTQFQKFETLALGLCLSAPFSLSTSPGEAERLSRSTAGGCTEQGHALATLAPVYS